MSALNEELKEALIKELIPLIATIAIKELTSAVVTSTGSIKQPVTYTKRSPNYIELSLDSNGIWQLIFNGPIFKDVKPGDINATTIANAVSNIISKQ